MTFSLNRPALIIYDRIQDLVVLHAVANPDQRGLPFCLSQHSSNPPPSMVISGKFGGQSTLVLALTLENIVRSLMSKAAMSQHGRK